MCFYWKPHSDLKWIAHRFGGIFCCFYNTIKYFKDSWAVWVWWPQYFAPITSPWQLSKMRINPSELVSDIEWPGAGLWHLCSLKPDYLIWTQRLSKLSHGSAVRDCLGLFILFALTVSVDEGRRKQQEPDKHQQTEEVIAGSLWIRLRLNVSPWLHWGFLPRAERNYFKQYMSWT